MRQLPASDYLNLKAVWRDLVALAGGNKRAAGITRGVESRISEAGAPHCEDRFPAADQVADLEAEVGEPVVTKMLAGMLGFDLVPREAAPARDTSPMQMLVGIIRECGEVETALAEAMADGRFTEFEIRTSLKQIDDAVAQLTAARGELMHKLKSNKGA